MNILIADDEPLVRSSLRSILSELDLPIRVVGEASNGEDLIKLAQLHQPDAAFVDIKMPKIDGLKAIETLKNLCPCTQWIILTGFSEFDYAKQAIRLGVVNYLLKPVSHDELSITLNEVFKKNTKYLAAVNNQFENDIIALFNDLLSPSLLDDTHIINSSHLMGGVFVVDSCLNEKTRAGYQLKFCNSVYSLIKSSLKDQIRLAFFVLPNGDMASVAVWKPNKSGPGNNLAMDYFKRLEDIIKNNKRKNFSITLLQSSVCDSLDLLRKQMNQLQNLSPLRIIIDKEFRINLSELAGIYKSSFSATLELADLVSKLSQHYKEKSYLNFMNIINDLENFFLKDSSLDYSQFAVSLERFLSYSINPGISNCSSFQMLIKKIRNLSETLIKPDGKSNDIIDEVISFIEENYMKDIGIAQIANQLDITPNYLSSVFHKKIGETFMKYLTRVRMIRARELLSSPNAQVCQVAEQVGYYTSRYFTKLYKEFFGVYPSDHIK